MADVHGQMKSPEKYRWPLGGLLALLALLCLVVLRPFLVPLIWAAIVAYTSWPLYRRLRRFCRDRDSLAALMMTALVALIIVAPLIWLVALLTEEVASLYKATIAIRAAGAMPLPAIIRTIPWIGESIQETLDRYLADPLLIRPLIVDWAQRLHAELLAAAGGLGRNTAKLLIAIVSIFFFYRDGDDLVRQATRVLERLFSNRLTRYLVVAGAMLKAVVFGLLVTAMVQGTIAGVGFVVFGVEAPVLMGMLTAITSIIPVVGTFLVWGSASAWLAATGHVWPALGLFAWGVVLVHPADNILRPLLISNATQLPFLLIMFGVVGGLAAFGLVGVFIGPVALAIAVAVWREWVE